MKEILLILLIPAVRFIVNINNWYYLHNVIKKHDEWVQGVVKNATDEDEKKAKAAATWIQVNTSKINRVVKLSGREAPIRSFMDAVGYGHVQEKQINLLDNLLFQNREVLSGARNVLHVAKGHFYTNAISSLNPIFWLETIFFLPRSIASASGIELTNKLTELAVNSLQMLYWLTLILIIIFRPELFDFILTQKPGK